MKEQTQIQASLPITYIHQHQSENPPGKLVLFLHGYTDSATSFLRRALQGSALKYSVLAPNGPFPLPVKNENTFKEAYSWYFWEYSSNRIVIPPKVSVEILQKLIDQLGFENADKVIVGFSQGGFLLPHLLPSLKNVKGAIAVGAAFRVEEYQSDFDYPIVGIHGDKDEIVTLEHSQATFLELLQKRNFPGEYHIISGLAHTMNKQASDLMIDKINQWLK